MNSYTPAQAASRSGFSLDTLRYYEKEGIITPVARTTGGRRAYSEDDLGRLGLVRCLRETGMPIAQLRRYSELTSRDETFSERLRLLEEHDAEVVRSVEQLLEQRERLLRKVAHYREKLGLAPYEPAAWPAADPARGNGAASRSATTTEDGRHAGGHDG
ncbi:MerR family transcriptional regulator [Streptomyces otsuchiensis]|uniref:MerR family transcriptional regulator n=1 Tax=Streptomyces otsuchiensis TaxID=2681388 RepID=UPI001031C989|nr:MerR family transcriptional regulator [Streptomyces otsuchiensis]